MKTTAITIFYGFIFGLILIKAEVLNWFRIYEMFQFQSVHMFAVLSSAIVTAMILISLIRTRQGTVIESAIKKRSLNKGTIIGGLFFGFGWGICGLCPGPIYLHLGLGYSSAVIIFVSALIGSASFLILRKNEII